MSTPADRVLQLTPRFQEALRYATDLHASQLRKDTKISYIAHLLSVAALVLEDGGVEDEAIAALLHDAVEDQGGVKTGEEIYRLFGATVGKIVDGCTDATTVPKPPWKGRKEKYIAHLRESTPAVLRVSVADKLHNARAVLADFRLIGDEVWGRFNPDAGKKGTLWYFRALVDAFRQSSMGGTPMVEELERVVTEVERLVSSSGESKSCCGPGRNPGRDQALDSHDCGKKGEELTSAHAHRR